MNNEKTQHRRHSRHDATHARPRARSIFRRCFALALGACALAASGLSAAPAVSAALYPAEIRPGAFTTYTITIESGVPDRIPQLNLPAGLEPTTLAPARGQQSTSDGRTFRQTYTLTWQIVCTKVGEYVIPSQQISIGGNSYDTGEARLVVKENPTFRVSKYDPLLNLEVEKREFYLGEVVPVTVSLYTHIDTRLGRVGLIEMPKESFAIQRFPLQGDATTISVGGVPYNVRAFQSTLSGLKPGKFTLGPASAEIILEVPSDESHSLHPFLRQTEQRKLHPPCNDIEVTVLPLPAGGRPSGFKNLVGDFELTVTAEPREVGLNEPVSVEMIVSGTGNFDAITVPEITDPNSWKVYPVRRYHVESSDSGLGGAPRSIGFSQVIMPRKKVDVVPPFELSYFSPQKKQYITLRSNPIPIVVSLPDRSVEPPPVAPSTAAGAAAVPDAEKVPQVRPNITDILANVPDSPTWLAMRPAPWADRGFFTANLIAGGALALLILGKLGMVAWRAHANSPLAPSRKLWARLEGAPLSRARFYRLAAAYISERGLAGERIQQVLDRHNLVNYGPPSGGAQEPIPDGERHDVLSALQAPDAVAAPLPQH